MILVGRMSVIVVQIKHQNIYWNLANLTGDAAGETYAFVNARPPYLILETPKLILTFIQTFKPFILV